MGVVVSHLHRAIFNSLSIFGMGVVDIPGHVNQLDVLFWYASVRIVDIYVLAGVLGYKSSCHLEH